MIVLKKLMAVLALAILGFLAGCGKTQEPIVEKVAVPTADEQWVRAEKEIVGMATDYVRKHDIRDSKDCNVKTAELSASPALYVFPIAGDRAYKAACKAEIEAQAKKRADIYAKGRADERKLAAKKPKQAEIAAGPVKKPHASSAQAARPSAVKPVAKTDRRS